MRILITCGPTWVALDEVRVISNRSSGEIGHLIAEYAAAHGDKVTLLEGPVTHPWHDPEVKVIKYRFFDELEKLLKEQLKKNYDCVIHAAAVSDFKLGKPLKGKIDSHKEISLKLVPTPKLIEQSKKHAPKTFLVGFKLEPGIKVENILKEADGLLKSAHCDLVVVNCIKHGYRGFIVDKEKNIWLKTDSKKVLARGLVRLIHQL